MPASPAGRSRRLGAGAAASVLSALSLVLAPGALAAVDREITVGADAPASWDGRAALALSNLFDPATLSPCGSSSADVCDTTLVHVSPEASGTLAFRLSPLDAGTPDVDLYVFRSDPLGVPAAPAGISAGAGSDEQVVVPFATGTYLVEAVSFSRGSAGYRGAATLSARTTAPPDVDDPRGLRGTLVSNTRAGAAVQPVVAQDPRDHDLLVAAYRLFPVAGTYASRIATAVSFDRGRHWLALGAVSGDVAANPAVAFDRLGDAYLVTNEQPDAGGWSLTVRRWSRPSAIDVLRRATWEAPSVLDTPPARSSDERPVLAAARSAQAPAGLMACWVRDRDLGGFGRQAILCRHSPDGARTWEATSQLSPENAPGLPFGPYVTGVALAAERGGAFSAAWIDTLTGTRDGSGLDPLRVARTVDGGATWSAPVLATRARPLPHTFAGDSFRNVPLLSLAAGRSGRLYLAYAAEQPGAHGSALQADVRLVRSDDAGATWREPVTVNQDATDADQFQPSLAVTRRGDVVVTFLDRRLDPANAFADEWLARSEDDGATWSETRLSHDSWDPATGAPHSPTGDLLGDHQAVVADDCSVVALAADPHLANDRSRDRGFDAFLPRSPVPQLFAWTVGHRRSWTCR
jgi:hypothetical protein